MKNIYQSFTVESIDLVIFYWSHRGLGICTLCCCISLPFTILVHAYPLRPLFPSFPFLFTLLLRDVPFL